MHLPVQVIERRSPLKPLQQHQTKFLITYINIKHFIKHSLIDGLQSIPKKSNDKDVAAMLDELTTEANEEYFVIVLQHGGNDVTMKTIYRWFAINP